MGERELMSDEEVDGFARRMGGDAEPKTPVSKPKFTLDDGLKALAEAFYTCDTCGTLILRKQAVSIPIGIGAWKAYCPSCAESEEPRRRCAPAVLDVDAAAKTEAIVSLARMLIQPIGEDGSLELIGHRRFREALMHGVRGFTFRPETALELAHSRIEDLETDVCQCYACLDDSGQECINPAESLVSRIKRLIAGAAADRELTSRAKELEHELDRGHDYLDGQGIGRLKENEPIVTRIDRLGAALSGAKEGIRRAEDRVRELEARGAG